MTSERRNISELLNLSGTNNLDHSEIIAVNNDIDREHNVVADPRTTSHFIRDKPIAS